MDDSLYSQKYDYIQNLANQYIKDHNLEYRGEDYEVHRVNELINEVRYNYNVIPPDDMHARYAVLPSHDSRTHAAFRKHLNDHFNSPEGVTNFIEVLTNDHLGKLPDAPPRGEKLPIISPINTMEIVAEVSEKLGITTNSSNEAIEKISAYAETSGIPTNSSSKVMVTAVAESLGITTSTPSQAIEKIEAVAESLGISTDSIIKRSDDNTKFEYREDYLSVIKAATKHKLSQDGMLEHNPLVVTRVETITTPARKGAPMRGDDGNFLKDNENKVKFHMIEATSRSTEYKDTIVESPDGWYLAKAVGDNKGTVEFLTDTKLLDISKIKGFTINGQKIEDIFRKKLKKQLASGLELDKALRAAIEEINPGSQTFNPPDIEKELFLISDQAIHISPKISKETIASASISDIKKLGEVSQGLMDNSLSSPLCDAILRQDTLSLNKILQFSPKTNANILNDWRGPSGESLVHVAAQAQNKQVFGNDMVTDLAEKGASFDIKDNNGKTAAMHYEEKSSMAKKLVRAAKNKDEIINRSIDQQKERIKIKTLIGIDNVSQDYKQLVDHIKKARSSKTKMKIFITRGEESLTKRETRAVKKLMQDPRGIKAILEEKNTVENELHKAKAPGMFSRLVKKNTPMVH